MKLTINFLFLTSIVIWIGSIFFLSFIAAPSIFKVLNREVAGNVVADIFPKFHLLSYICGITALACTVTRIYFFESKLRFQNLTLILVVFMLGLSVYSGEVVGPKAAEVKTELRETVPASQTHRNLDKEFKKLHLFSVIITLSVFIFGIAIILITAYNYRV